MCLMDAFIMPLSIISDFLYTFSELLLIGMVTLNGPVFGGLCLLLYACLDKFVTSYVKGIVNK